MKRRAGVMAAFVLCSGSAVTALLGANAGNEKILSAREAVWHA